MTGSVPNVHDCCTPTQRKTHNERVVVKQVSNNNSANRSKMADNWDDEWDAADDDDDELDKKLGLKKMAENLPTFDDEEDLALKEREEMDRHQTTILKKKGNALLSKKQAELERQEELELARKAMELEAQLEANLSSDELRALKQKQIEDADNALTDDLFGGVDNSVGKGVAESVPAQAGDKVVMTDIKDHLKHARKVAECLRGHGQIHLAATFFKEAIQQSKDVLDDDAVADLIKTLNVILNEKVKAQKQKVKGQASKPKKDKVAIIKAQKVQVDTFGDNDKFDKYDVYGEDYEDSFF
jgi:translation initiation factor 3 subunit J